MGEMGPLGAPPDRQPRLSLVVGGIGTLIGGFVGAAVFVYARDVLSSLSPVYWMFWLGLLLMAAGVSQSEAFVVAAREWESRPPQASHRILMSAPKC